jgi:hypothetical protein
MHGQQNIKFTNQSLVTMNERWITSEKREPLNIIVMGVKYNRLKKMWNIVQTTFMSLWNYVSHYL